MEKPTNPYIRKAIRLASQMNGVADAGEAHCDDDSCAVLFGVMRDCAYAIRHRAEEEKSRHERMGLWDSGRNAGRRMIT
jgi:hypothetical protein